MAGKYTYEYVKDYIESKNCILLSEKYISCKEELEIVGQCGHSYFLSFDLFKNRKRYQCADCGNKQSLDKKRLHYDKVKQYIENRGCILLNTEYKNSYEYLDIIFACGHRGKRDFAHFKKTQSLCYFCSTNSHRYEDIKNIVESNDYTLLSKEYNPNKKLNIVDSSGYKYCITFYGFEKLILKNKTHLELFDSNPYSDFNARLFLKLNASDIFISKDVQMNNCAKKIDLVDSMGYKFKIVFSSMITQAKAGTRPSKFDSSNPYTLENIQLYLRLNNKPFYLLPNQKFVKVTKPLMFKCNNCEESEIPFSKKFIDIERGEGCPYCSGKKVGKCNSLFYLDKDISAEWDYEKNGNLTPDKVVLGSLKKAWWVCPNCGESYYSQIYKRVKMNRGCPRCRESHLEKKISKFLNANNIRYIPQKRFHNCRDIIPLPFDFYIFDYNILCEAQGEQHFSSCDIFGGEYAFITCKKHDKIKKDYAAINEFRFLEIPYWDFDNIESILTKELNL